MPLYSIIYSFNKHKSNTYEFSQQIVIECLLVPGPRLAAKDTAVSKADKIPCPHRAYGLVNNSGQHRICT